MRHSSNYNIQENILKFNYHRPFQTKTKLKIKLRDLRANESNSRHVTLLRSEVHTTERKMFIIRFKKLAPKNKFTLIHSVEELKTRKTAF